jgi:hypothetical protein
MQVSSLTSNKDVSTELVAELVWAVTDMQNQASNHNTNAKETVQVRTYDCMCTNMYLSLPVRMNTFYVLCM